MAGDYISLRKAVTEGIIKIGENVNPYLLYLYSATSVILKSSETGIGYDKVIPRRRLKWVLSYNKQGIISLWSNVPDYEIELKGEIGFENGPMLFERISKMYSNYGVGTITRPITMEDVDYLLLDKITYNILAEDREQHVWLPNKKICRREDDTFYGLMGLHNCCKEQKDLFSTTQEYENNGKIKLVMEFYNLDKILVDLGSMEERGEWKLVEAN